MSLRRFAPAVVIAAAAFVAVMPLLINGCSCGHDFDFHLVNWLEAHRQFAHGDWHPQWAYTAAWNAGEPRFIFYPPLSWTIGGILGFVFPFTAVPIVYTWLCLFLCGMTCHRMIRNLHDPERSPIGTGISVCVSTLYLANPYILFTAYERTAYAELLAAAWMPLLITALLRRQIRPVELAMAVALLWLTNLPAAVAACYIVLLGGLIRLAVERQAAWKNALSMTLGTTLGMCMSGFYLVPALMQKKWVQTAMVTIGGMQIRENFLFARTSDPLHDTVLWQASRIAVCLLTLSIVLAVCLHRRTAFQRVVVVLGSLSLAVLILLLPASRIVWDHAPQLSFLQFPWRFLSVQQAVLAALLAMFLAATAAWWNRRAVALLCLTLTVCLTAAASHSYRQGCDEEDAPQTHIALFARHGGVEPIDEYTITGADNDLLGHSNPGWWLADTIEGAATPDVFTPQLPDNLHILLEINSRQSAYLIVNRRAYPAWEIAVNGTPVKPLPRGDGLIAVHIPSGKSSLSVEPQWAYGSDVAGLGVTFAALAITLGVAWRQHHVRFRAAGSGPTVYS